MSRPMSTLRALLIGSPLEFNPYRDGRVPESDRQFMTRQARAVCNFNGGIGVSYLRSAELERIRDVWLRSERRPPPDKFSDTAVDAMQQAEAADPEPDEWAAP